MPQTRNRSAGNLESPYYRSAVDQVAAGRAFYEQMSGEEDEDADLQQEQAAPEGPANASEPAQGGSESDVIRQIGEQRAMAKLGARVGGIAPGGRTPPLPTGRTPGGSPDDARDPGAAGVPAGLMTFRQWGRRNYPDLARDPTIDQRLLNRLYEQYGHYVAVNRAVEESAMRRAQIEGSGYYARGRPGARTEEPIARLEAQAVAELEQGRYDGPAMRAYERIKGRGAKPGAAPDTGRDFDQLLIGVEGDPSRLATDIETDPVNGWWNWSRRLLMASTGNQARRRAAVQWTVENRPSPEQILTADLDAKRKGQILRAAYGDGEEAEQMLLVGVREGWLSDKDFAIAAKTALNPTILRDRAERQEAGKRRSTLGAGVPAVIDVQGVSPDPLLRPRAAAPAPPDAFTPPWPMRAGMDPIGEIVRPVGRAVASGVGRFMSGGAIGGQSEFESPTAAAGAVRAGAAVRPYWQGDMGYPVVPGGPPGRSPDWIDGFLNGLRQREQAAPAGSPAP